MMFSALKSLHKDFMKAQTPLFQNKTPFREISNPVLPADILLEVLKSCYIIVQVIIYTVKLSFM